MLHCICLIAALIARRRRAAAELAGSRAESRPSTCMPQPKLESPKVATLKRDATVTISAQQGLWYQLQAADGKTGYVRVNDVRIDYAGVEDGDANLRVLTTRQGWRGRVTETAGVRGIDESDLKSAALNQAQLDAMIAQPRRRRRRGAMRAEHGWQATTVAYAAEAKPASKEREGDGGIVDVDVCDGQPCGGMLGSFGQQCRLELGTAAKVVPKSEAERRPRNLRSARRSPAGSRRAPAVERRGAQQRVNVIGRWVASQTSRPELPWTFGVIDTPEINAFAAPGGYVLVTRGMYEMLSSDGEIAAVLGHEISHCVQRDHYNVIRKQEMATVGKDVAVERESASGHRAPPSNYARQYVEKHGATIMLTSLDREAEFRADKAAEIYLARSGMNPLALYAVLQKMAALGSESASLAAAVQDASAAG